MARGSAPCCGDTSPAWSRTLHKGAQARDTQLPRKVTLSSRSLLLLANNNFPGQLALETARDSGAQQAEVQELRSWAPTPLVLGPVTFNILSQDFSRVWMPRLFSSSHRHRISSA